MVRVNLYATFRDITGRKRLELRGEKVGVVLESLVKAYPAMAGELFEEGHLSDRCSVFLEGREVCYLEGLDTRLEDGTTLDLFPPVAGGAALDQVFGGLSTWLLLVYLKDWGGTIHESGAHMPGGAEVRVEEISPLVVGQLSVSQLRVMVDGPGAGEWMARITRAAMRGGG